MSLSFGGNPSEAVDQAVSSLVGRGLTVVAAAGNAAGDACAMTPGRNPAVITVGATTSTDARLSISNWGPCVDLSAPGDAINSAGISSVSATSVQTGTSMAAPHVAGAAALMIAEGAHDPAAVRCHLTEQGTVGRLTDLVGSPDRLLYVGLPATSSSTSPCGELTPYTSDPLPVAERLAGGDRFATAAVLSARRFEPGVPVVYLATGASFADALAAGPIAGGIGPVLLVRRDSIPAATVAELTRLSPGRIMVLGGEAVVGADVFLAARSFTSGSVTRIGAADRFATAAQLSASSVVPGVDTVFVATGVSFADALSAGPAAAGLGPVVLTRPDRVPAATVEELVRLRPGRIVVLGGPGAVSDAVLTELRTYTTGSVVRWAGVDRFATSVAISQARFSPGVDAVFLATGSSFADALAAGPVAAGLGPVLLARAECVPRVVLDEIERLGPAEVVVVGGSGALGAGVMALTPCG